MSQAFTNEELARAEDLAGKINALISAAYANGVQSGLAEAETKAMDQSRHERILEMGRIYGLVGSLLNEDTAEESDGRMVRGPVVHAPPDSARQ